MTDCGITWPQRHGLTLECAKAPCGQPLPIPGPSRWLSRLWWVGHWSGGWSGAVEKAVVNGHACVMPPGAEGTREHGSNPCDLSRLLTLSARQFPYLEPATSPPEDLARRGLPPAHPRLELSDVLQQIGLRWLSRLRAFGVPRRVGVGYRVGGGDHLPPAPARLRERALL